TPPRALPCVGAWLRIRASESLECGRARLVRGEYEEAARALEHAVQGATDRDLLAEARYWHGEVLYLRGEYPRADWAFRQVAQDAPRGEFGPWALHGSGWTALRLGDAVRAEESFRRLLSAPHPVPLDVWGRHGLGLALYSLSRWADAEKIWADLAPRRLPVALTRDLAFWHGDTLGRMGQAERAVEKLSGFTQRGAHALLPLAWVRLGWWQFAAGRPAEAAAAFRAFLGGPAPTVGDAALEREWAQAGLALALIATGDAAGARTALAALDARRSVLTVPIRIRLAARAVDNGQAGEALGAVQELLSGSLTGPVRAWVLVIKGEAHRIEGNRDEARTQFDLARGLQPGSETGRYATFRMAQMNFELREFGQAVLDLAPLLGVSAGPDLRAAALLLEGEAAYQEGDYARAANAYRRALVEFPGHSQTTVTRLALAWTALRQGQRDAALRQFMDFARDHPGDPRAVDALLLASELALDAGQLDRARELLERIVTAHATNPRAELARLNRALLRVRAGELGVAERELTDWIARAPSPALLGRAWAALGAARLASGRAAEAAQAYQRARDEGLTEIGRLGLGMAALLQERWDDAARDLTEARDTGTPAITAAAEYGLAVVAYHRGRRAEFKPTALAALQAAPRGPRAARLLYVLVGLAVEERDWPAALSHARRLLTEYPQDEAADDALERVGAAAAAAAWPPAWEAYALLRQHYAKSPFIESSRFAFARALQETGRSAEARRAYEEFVASSPNDPQALEAWLALARAREAAGDRKGAVDAFARAAQTGANPTTHRESFVTYARALSAERRWNEARLVWERLLAVSDAAAAVDMATSVGDAWAGQGEHLAAAEYYMTAAYLAPDSPAGRQALLAAGRSFAAARDAEAAAIVYRKLIIQKDVPADLAEQARRALAELRR
ncbi:MAG: tetratricopeptide repeat protein, partial [Candidatus Rokuibacteriota bacterium]